MSAQSVAGQTTADITGFFKALGDETRLTIIRMLALTDLRVSDIVERLQIPQNALSYHLRHLSRAGLLRDHRSSADARDIYYSVDWDRLEILYLSAGNFIHPAMAMADPAAGADAAPLRVLFLCSHNSARSQLAEGIMRQLGGNKVEVFSAGVEPTEVHPDTTIALVERGIDPSSHAAKAIDQFYGQSFDYIITVCDMVRELCPVPPTAQGQIHWSLSDPTLIEDQAVRREAFVKLGQELAARINRLLSVPPQPSGRHLVLPPTMFAGGS